MCKALQTVGMHIHCYNISTFHIVQIYAYHSKRSKQSVFLTNSRLFFITLQLCILKHLYGFILIFNLSPSFRYGLILIFSLSPSFRCTFYLQSQSQFQVQFYLQSQSQFQVCFCLYLQVCFYLYLYLHQDHSIYFLIAFHSHTF